MLPEIEKNTDAGTIFNSLNVKGIKKIRILLPPENLINKFEKITRPLRENIEQNEFNTQQLESLRDLLLPKLMSGQIRVPVEVSR